MASSSLSSLKAALPASFRAAGSVLEPMLLPLVWPAAGGITKLREKYTKLISSCTSAEIIVGYENKTNCNQCEVRVELAGLFRTVVTMSMGDSFYSQSINNARIELWVRVELAGLFRTVQLAHLHKDKVF